jgi:hypothetical protein
MQNGKIIMAVNSKGIPNINATIIRIIIISKIEATRLPVRVVLPVFIIVPIVSVLFINSILISPP